MRTTWLLLLLTLTLYGAAFAQSPAPDTATPKHETAAAESEKLPKKTKEADKAAKKRDKDAEKIAAKKAENAQNQVNAQAYRTTVPKP
jgi:hypothetical protein